MNLFHVRGKNPSEPVMQILEEGSTRFILLTHRMRYMYLSLMVDSNFALFTVLKLILRGKKLHMISMK